MTTWILDGNFSEETKDLVRKALEDKEDNQWDAKDCRDIWDSQYFNIDR